MTELTAADVEAFTNGRLGDDASTTQLLHAALAAARRYCGWHVSPVETDTLTLDGPCGRVLDLPTRKLSSVDSITEDDVTVDVAKLSWSSNGSVRKKAGGCWSCDYSAISATITHGFTEDEAADWRVAILSMVSEMSLTLSAGEAAPTGGLTRKRIDDVEYEWSDQAVSQGASRAVYSVSSVLDDYRRNMVLFA